MVGGLLNLDCTRNGFHNLGLIRGFKTIHKMEAHFFLRQQFIVYLAHSFYVKFCEILLVYLVFL